MNPRVYILIAAWIAMWFAFHFAIPLGYTIVILGPPASVAIAAEDLRDESAVRPERDTATEQKRGQPQKSARGVVPPKGQAPDVRSGSIREPLSADRSVAD